MNQPSELAALYAEYMTLAADQYAFAAEVAGSVSPTSVLDDVAYGPTNWSSTALRVRTERRRAQLRAQLEGVRKRFADAYSRLELEVESIREWVRKGNAPAEDQRALEAMIHGVVTRAREMRAAVYAPMKHEPTPQEAMSPSRPGRSLSAN